MTEPKLIALDVALEVTGLVNIDGWPMVSKGQKNKDGMDKRLRRLYDDVYRIAKDADLAIMEDLPKSGMSTGLTGQAVGVARMALADCDVPMVKVVSSTLKLFATGKGAYPNSALGKEAMVAAANIFKAGKGLAHYPVITDHNEADAFCLWTLGIEWLRGGGRARAANVNNWDSWDKRLEELGYGRP